MKKYSRVCAYIDLDAFVSNYEQLYKVVQGEHTKMVGVIKSDGYGHGSVPLGKAIEDAPYLWGFAVATADEGIQLRNAGLQKPILVLGCVFPDQYADAVTYDLRPTPYTLESARELSAVAEAMGKTVTVHIKLDTGMSRLGFLPCEESIDTILEIAAQKALKLEGMFTHFAKADETDKTFTRKQEQDYHYMKDGLAKRGLVFEIYHQSNSAGIIDVPTAHMDLVRAGIAGYGIYPSDEVNRTEAILTPVMSIISHVAHVKWVEAGTPVSYGGTFVTSKKTRVATIPVGYGDGYPRSLSNKGWVLIHGKKAPILGRVCMDQFMVDVSEIPETAFGDKVTLLGTDGAESLIVDTLSELSNRFPYEFVCDIGKRIPRSYVKNGQVVSQTDYF